MIDTNRKGDGGQVNTCPLLVNMNNKKIGSDFEKEMSEILTGMGFWVHFMSPAPDGSQPCDLIFAKNGQCYIADCKTSSKNKFGIERLEYNQIFSFERWMACGNNEPGIFVKCRGAIYNVPYLELKTKGKVVLDEIHRFK